MALNLGSIGEAWVNIRANLKTLDRDLKNIGMRIQRAGSGFNKVGRRVSLGLTLPIFLLGAQTVKTASQVQEMINLFEVTFEDASKDVANWAKVNAKAMQRSRFEFMQTASDFAAFLKPLGVASKAIVPMSKALTALTTDLSSFRNVAEKEVFIRLFSGLAGETEAVRRLGIDIGVASINIELLRLGIEKTSAEATQAEKVIARFNLIMRQTTDAQGDAVRTSLFFENQMRGLKAVMKDVAVVIGQKFLPAATKMVQELRKMGRRFVALDPAVQSGVLAIVAFVGVLGPAIIVIGLLLQAIGFAVAGFALLGPVLRVAITAIRFLFIGIQVVVIGFLGFFSTVPGLIIVSLTALISGFLVFGGTVIGFFKGLILAIKDAFISGFNNLITIPFQEQINKIGEILRLNPFSALRQIGGNLRIGVNDVIDPEFKDDMKKVIGDAMEGGKEDIEEFKKVATKAVAVVKSSFATIKDAVTDFLPDFSFDDFTLAGLGANFDDLLAQFAALTNAAGGLGGAIGKAADTAGDAWKDVMEDISASVEDGLIDAALAFKSFGEVALDVLRQIFAEIIRFALIRPFLVAIGLPVPVPGLEHGGDVRANEAVIVGEGGTELFVPNVSGKIIPNNRIHLGRDGDSRARGNINQEFNFPLVFPTQLEAFVRNVAGSAGRDGAIQVLRAREGKF